MGGPEESPMCKVFALLEKFALDEGKLLPPGLVMTGGRLMLVNNGARVGSSVLSSDSDLRVALGSSPAAVMRDRSTASFSALCSWMTGNSFSSWDKFAMSYSPSVARS